jgi:hypothetical protein
MIALSVRFELLEPMLAKWRSPDLLSPLGRAHLGVGRVAEGRAMLREALSLNPEHLNCPGFPGGLIP